MKTKYEVGQRISFIARNEIIYGGKRIFGPWKHHVGYVKQVRKTLFGERYVTVKAKSDEIYILSSHNIIGLVEKREETNTQIK